MNHAYNALTAAELLKVITDEVHRALEKEIGNSPAITYPLASWSWTLTLLQSDPSTGATADTPERTITAGDPSSIERAKKADMESFRLQVEAENGKPPKIDADGNPETPMTPAERLLRSLSGGSKRFRTRPPAPTEVRQEENLPLPEA